MVTYATAHNGGRSQVNMNYMATSGDYPFINMLKGATTGWTMESNVASMPPNQLNSDGYPNDLTGTGGGCYVRIFIPTQLERSGNWKMTWTGSGTTLGVGAAGGVTTVAGSLTTNSYEFSLTGAASYLDIHIYILGAGVSNLQVFHTGDETDLLAGQTFTAKFKAKLREANFGVIRFLNWLNINTNMSTVWAYRKPLTHWSWAAYQYAPELYAGQTTNSTGTYAVSVPGTLKHSSDGTTWTNGDAPKDKDTIIVRFGAAITSGAMTLKVGTGGSATDIAVVNPSCFALSTAGNDYPLINRYATFIYDSGLAKWMKWGGDVANGYDTGIDNGIPIEVALQLCAEIGAHPWFGTPVYALDPMTDYVPSLATYVHTNQQSWMVPRFEVSNELWNPQFFSSNYAPAKATANGWTSPNLHQWYGKTLSTMGQAVNTVYGGSPHTQTAYQVCCAVQTASGNTTASCATSDERMTAAAYVGQAAAAQSPYTKSAASTWVTHITCANYFDPVLDRTSDGNPAPLQNSLATTLGAVRFVVSSCSGGSLVVSSIETSGGAMSTGMTLVGLGVSAGTTITAGSYPNFTISDASLTLQSGYQVYAYLTAGYSAVQDYVDTVHLPVTFNASTSGSTMTVHSTTGPTTGAGSIQVGMYLTWAGSFSNSYITALGTGTGGTGTYTLNGTPGSGAITTTDVTGFWLYDYTYSAILFANWKTWAQGFSIQKMNFYEGGYSPDYLPSGDYTSAVSCMKYISKFVASTSRNGSGLGGYTTENYNLCTSLTGGGFVSEFPSQYLMTGPYPSLQIWNMLETIYRTPNGPQFDAIVAYNQVAQYFINLRLRLHA